MMRLDRFLAINGIGTRKEVKKLVQNGRVSVDGKLAKNSDLKIEEQQANVEVDGKRIVYEEYHYLMLHKPSGYVSSMQEKGQHTVFELIKEPFVKDLSTVGRLDKDTEGLMILTDDGPLIHKLMAPGKHVDKTYLVHLEHPVSEKERIAFEEGLDIGDEKKTLPAKMESTMNPAEVYVTLQEGRFHQIKRMFEVINNKVLYLKRISIKNLVLDDSLKIGEYRRLTEVEVEDLKK